MCCFETLSYYQNQSIRSVAAKFKIFHVAQADTVTSFDGRELSTEYLFGLFVQIEGDSNRPSLIGAPKSYEVRVHVGAMLTARSPP